MLGSAISWGVKRGIYSNEAGMGCGAIVSAADGSLIVNQVPGLEYGIKWTQHALVSSYNAWFGKLLAIIIVLFVFTSLMGYCYQAESNVRYLLKNSRIAVWVCRGIFIAASFSGALIDAEAIWTIGDTGAGIMAWLNIIAILLLSKKGFALLKDYEEQLKEGKEPVFVPEKFGINDKTGVWREKSN